MWKIILKRQGKDLMNLKEAINHDGVVVFESELTSIIKSPHNDTNYLGFRGLELMEVVFDSEL